MMWALTMSHMKFHDAPHTLMKIRYILYCEEYKFVHIAGIGFFKTQAGKIKYEADSHRPSGFEIVFPAMLKEAKILGLDLPYELSFINKSWKSGTLSLKR